MTVKTVLNKLKSTFLPSESVSAARREKTFGTESKAVAGTVIVGAAAAALATGPVVLASAAKKGVTTAAKAVSKVVAANPIKSTVIATVGTSALISSKELRKDVAKTASNVPSELVGVGAGIGEAYSEIKTGDLKSAGETLIETAKDNPVGSVIAGVGLVGTTAAGVYYGTKIVSEAISGTEKVVAGTENLAPDIKTETEVSKELATGAGLPSTQTKTVSSIPLTPETQVVGKEVKSSSTKKKYKKIRQNKGNSQSMRVNIFTNSRVVSTKYLKLGY